MHILEFVKLSLGYLIVIPV